MKATGVMSTVGVVLALVLAGCGSAATPQSAPAVEAASSGATVTFGLPPNEIPNSIFPLVDLISNANLFDLQYLLYRPLYWFGTNGTPVQNPKFSVGDAPVFSNSGRTVTITLKSYHWSDGQPVTNRDIEFWMNLLIANKDHWFDYVPGLFPDNVVSMSFPADTPSKFSLTFNKAYSQTWLIYNELSQIIPLPQQSWDRTSAAGPVGDYDTTTAGATAVFNYLTTQATTVSTYATNPIWKVVDGPWELTNYAPSTGYAVFTPNPDYTGPKTGNVTRFEELPFTSDAAEFDALRSGQLDYGYIPSEDLSQSSYFTARHYILSDWTPWGYNSIVLNYTNPHVGALFAQLYIRQALQRAIDQPQIDRDVFKNTAYPTYGPVPVKPASPFLTKLEKDNPLPYSLSAAEGLLKSHGWAIHSTGEDTCQRPGTGPGDCGAGIAKNEKLALTEEFASGSEPFAAAVEGIRSAWSQIGVQVGLTEKPTNQIFLNLSPCVNGSGGCSWEMANIGSPGSTPTYSPDYYPTGETFFETGAETNVGGYSNSYMNSLISSTQLNSSLKVFDTYENYAATHLPDLWEPNFYYQTSVIRSGLKGALPQNPNLNINPEMWTFKS
ncbi:MAG: ABC transporter substrate-binding protein [Candidatus Dormiibacterota bacterium]